MLSPPRSASHGRLARGRRRPRSPTWCFSRWQPRWSWRRRAVGRRRRRSGPHRLGRTGLTALGRLTGLVASDLLLVQVLLMARIPWVERAYGQDALARRHRLVGLHLVQPDARAHRARSPSGYAAAAAHDRAAPQPGTSSSTTPACCSPPPAPRCSCMVVVTVDPRGPPPAALRVVAPAAPLRLPRRRAGAAAPAVDRAATSSRSPAARVYWWTPVARPRRRRARSAGSGCRSGARCGTGCGSSPSCPRGARRRLGVPARPRAATGCPSRAGQFFLWRFLDGPGWTRGHPYSLSAAPHRPTLRITVKDLGDGSRAARRAAARARGCWSRARTARLTDATAHPARRCALLGRRHRHHAAARAARGPAHAPGDVLVLPRRTPATSSSRDELDAARARAAPRVVYLPRPRARRTGVLAARPTARPRRRRGRAAPAGARRRRPRRLPLRPRRLDGRRAAPPSHGRRPRRPVHLERFTW